jgi:hypothetical protein
VQNKLPFAVNLALDDGLLSPNDTQYTDPVQPSSTVVYRFQVPAEAAPGPNDMSTVSYTYSSSVDPIGHTNAGLMGTYYIGRQVLAFRFLFARQQLSEAVTIPLKGVSLPRADTPATGFHNVCRQRTVVVNAGGVNMLTTDFGLSQWPGLYSCTYSTQFLFPTSPVRVRKHMGAHTVNVVSLRGSLFCVR